MNKRDLLVCPVYVGTIVRMEEVVVRNVSLVLLDFCYVYPIR